MGSGFEISVKDVLRVVEAMDGLLSDFAGSTQDVSRVVIPTSSYGQVGSTAATATTTAQNQLVLTLRVLATVLQKINQRVEASADGYAGSDRHIAGVLAQMADAERAAFSNRH